ncbi:hypothetical protein [Nocardiopsis dassonvillei]|uniref:hypothetical protein n=1 Tax=Nocardiopsis dassonvillei TaxID=2014 RepID=UPI00367097E0
MSTKGEYLCLTCKTNHDLEAFVVEKKGELMYRSGRCTDTARDGGGMWFPADPDDVDRMLEKKWGARTKKQNPLCLRCKRRKPLQAFWKGVRDGVRVRAVVCKKCRPTSAVAWVPLEEEDAS